MSPPVVVMVSAPLLTAYFVASSRTIEFQTVLLRLVPLKSSPGPAAEALPEHPSGWKESDLAVTLLAAAVCRAKKPTLVFAGRFAGWPARVQLVPSVE